MDQKVECIYYPIIMIQNLNKLYFLQTNRLGDHTDENLSDDVDLLKDLHTKLWSLVVEDQAENIEEANILLTKNFVEEGTVVDVGGGKVDEEDQRT